MKKLLVYILILLSLVALAMRFGYQPVSDFLGSKARGGVKITSLPSVATVFIDGMEVGKTPYDNENLTVGEHDLKLIKDNVSWQGLVKLTKGTLAVVNRELAPNVASSSGETLILDSGVGVAITSNPSGASVEIDGKGYGVTPLQINNLLPGEHTFLLGHNNYLKRSIQAALPPKMVLYLDVDLAISELDLSSVFVPVTTTTSRLVVKRTPTGFLRVRDKPTVNGREVGRVVPGDNLTLIEELSGWDKVRLDSGVEGYVSALYIQKLNN